MKEKFIIVGLLVLITLVCCCCGKSVERSSKSVSAGKEKEDKSSTGRREEENMIFDKTFGSYEILAGWEENKEHSTENQFFYVKEGTGEQAQPNNIAVSVGLNHYNISESEDFKEAIQRQLSEQLSGYDEVTLTGSGFEAGDNTVYLFTVTEEDTGLVTRQYYIVGDQKFCLVQESNFEQSEECEKAAKKIVESFQWK